jgi:hypothetical protein
MKKKEAVLIDDHGGLAKKRNEEKKPMEPFSLSRRGRLKSFRQVSWLGLCLLAAPSRPSTAPGTVA